MRVLCIHQEAESSLGSLLAPLADGGHELVEWHAWRDEAPLEPAQADAVIALGGVANPDQADSTPWMERQRTLLADLARRDVPLLAVCLGAQLLAAGLGAPVARTERWELGWYELELAPAARDDALLGGFPARSEAFQWHDFGFEAPPGAVTLARSQRSPCQAFRAGRRAWGLQFHVEVDAATIEWWTRDGAAEMAAKRVPRDEVLAVTAREIDAYTRRAHELAGRFLAVAAVQEPRSYNQPRCQSPPPRTSTS